MMPASHSSIFLRPSFMRGMTYAGFERDLFQTPASDDAIDRLLETGTQWVAVAPGWYQPNRTATHISPHPHKTPSDPSLTYLIQRLHAKGVRVLLKPFVDSLDHAWRAHFRPTHWHQWFSSYLNMMLHYAYLAQELRVELLCVGVENTLGDAAQQVYWKNLIQAVRKVYTGPMTFAANFDHPQAYKDVQFWDSLDYVGIDAYFSVASRPRASLAHMQRRWGRVARSLRGWRARHAPDRPVLFTELGVSSYVGAACLPWQHPPQRQPDFQEQARYYQLKTRQKSGYGYLCFKIFVLWLISTRICRPW